MKWLNHVMMCSCKGAHSLKHICPNGAKKYFFPSIENDARMLEEIKGVQEFWVPPQRRDLVPLFHKSVPPSWQKLLKLGKRGQNSAKKLNNAWHLLYWRHF